MSPKKGRVGKLRPAYGEYGAFGKTRSAAGLSRVPMSVVVDGWAHADIGQTKAQHDRDDHEESLSRHGRSAPSRRVRRTRRHPVIRAASRPTNQTAATIPMA